MGFEIPSSLIHLTFDKYPGLEVQAESLSLGEMMALEGEAASLRGGQGSSEKAVRLIDAFADRLRSWNCERWGEPVPATREGFYSLDARFSGDILLAWYDAVTGEDVASSPLGRTSNGGWPSGAPSIPTETLSDGRPNWLTPS